MKNKCQQISNIKFLTVLAVIGIILVLAGFLIRESDHQVIRAADSAQGSRISEPFYLGQITNVASSSIEWVATTPSGTNITIQTATTSSETQEPTSWTNATSGWPIPGIEEGADLSGQYLWTKQILENEDPDINPSPQLDRLTVSVTMSGEIEGYRISPAIDLFGSGTVKSSQIFWQADEKFNGIISGVYVKVSYNGGLNWSDEWMPVTNGGNIPGLEPGMNLSSGAEIKTKVSFVGGPDFYPALENIKIFIETE